VISNMELRNAYPGTHATANASFLSAAKAKWTESTDYYLGTTVDQVAAQQIGQQTLLPSLELSMDLLQTVGQCDNGYACVYQNNLSWSSPTTPLPAEAHPRSCSSGCSARAARRPTAGGAARRASLLDSVREDITRLQRSSGRRIARASVSTSRRCAKWSAASRRPKRDGRRAAARSRSAAGVPAAYADHAR
jgi:hypothetical protein